MKQDFQVKLPWSIKPVAVDQALRTRRIYPQLFEIKIWSLLDETNFGWGPEKVTRLALVCKN